MSCSRPEEESHLLHKARDVDAAVGGEERGQVSAHPRVQLLRAVVLSLLELVETDPRLNEALEEL